MSEKSKNPKLRKNGGEGTFVGNLLRKMGKKKTLSDILKVTGNIIKGDVTEAIDIIMNSGELSEHERELLLKEIELDIVEQQEITKRWEADLKSEHWLPQLIRPLVVANFTILIDVVILSSMWGEPLGENYLPLIMTMGITAIGGYFSVREIGKYNKLKNE